MGDVLYGIRLAMGEVVAWVDAPRRTRARMVSMQDSVQHRIAQIDVARGHIDLGPQHPCAVRKLAGPHAPEQV
jgi:hypothetical protein